MREVLRLDGVSGVGPDLQELLVAVARGDEAAFARVYDAVAGPVLGLVRSVLRDPAQSEEVAQEVLVEVWQTATRFQASRGSAMTWVMTLAHRRAVDRVRSAQAAFLAAGMPTPGAGKTYELWFDDAGTMRPAGLMDPSATDHAVVLHGRIDNASAVGVTVEPAGGSEQPTSAPLALVTFPAAAGA